MSFYTFFPRLLNMSLTASIAILLVLLLRLALKHAPKVLSYSLWAIVLFRLLCPVSIESRFSLYSLLDTPTETRGPTTSAMEYVPSDIVHTEFPQVTLPLPVIDEPVENAVNDSLPQGQEQLSADPLEGPVYLATVLWLAGVGAMASYAAVSYLRLRRKLTTSSPLCGNVWLADGISSPFVMGLLRPKIYLPSDMGEQEREYILLHEKHHIRRLDHVIKLLSFAALSVHWFNPLVWVAFIQSGKDMEMSCDEAVIKQLGGDIRADYSASLLRLATGKPILSGMPLAFGEGDPKGRILNLARWKKPAKWIVVLALLACLVLSVCLLTNPLQKCTELMGAEYDIDRYLYGGDHLKEHPLEVRMAFCITADYHLYDEHNAHDGWSHLGKLEPYPLTKKELLSYIPNEKLEGYRLSRITDAFILQQEDASFYLAFQTGSGDTLIGYGLEDRSERGQGASDDTALLWLCRVESTFQNGHYNGNFFQRSLRHTVDANVYAFAAFTSTHIPDYHIEGFKFGESTDHNAMTGMGFAVFKTSGDGYKLIDCKAYPDAVLAENGIYFCPDPAIADENGISTDENTYDVILIANDQVKTIRRVYHAAGKEDWVQEDTNLNAHTMSLWHWSKEKGYTGFSQYFLDEDGNEISYVTEYNWNGRVREWFDYQSALLVDLAAPKEIALDAFPGVTFRWEGHRMAAVIDGEAEELFIGTPIWNAYFADVTGDGLPEICATAAYNDCDHVRVYDYANGVSYSLMEHNVSEYQLSLKDGKLLVTQKDYRSNKILDQGYLAYMDNTVQLLPVGYERDALEQATHEAILGHYADHLRTGLVPVESHVILDKEVMSGTPLAGNSFHSEQVTLYLHILYQTFDLYGDTPQVRGGSYVPTVLTFMLQEDGSYLLKEYWEPRDGSYYSDDIKKKFPAKLVQSAFDGDAYIEDLKADSLDQALTAKHAQGFPRQNIQKLMDTICASPAQSSAPADYINAHPEEYQALLDYDEFTLRYCYERFLSGKQTDLQAIVMQCLICDIAASWGEPVLMLDSDPPLTAQQWFDQVYLSHAKSLEIRNSEETMAKYYPAAQLLLDLLQEQSVTIMSNIHSFDGTQVLFDEVEWIDMYQDTVRQQALDLDPLQAPNGYYLYNEAKELQQLPMAKDCVCHVLNWEKGYTPIDLPAEAFQDLIQQRIKAYGLDNVIHIPYYLTVTDGQITQIQEQYVP